MNYEFGKGKKIIYKCHCLVEFDKPTICKVNDRLVGSCGDSFVIHRDFTGDITPEQCLQDNLIMRNKSVCRYAGEIKKNKIDKIK